MILLQLKGSYWLSNATIQLHPIASVPRRGSRSLQSPVSPKQAQLWLCRWNQLWKDRLLAWIDDKERKLCQG